MRYPWQASDWQRINRERTRVPNAWLLTGLAGIGKGEFAKELARSLLCDHPGPDYQPCGQCESCHWFAIGAHPDYRHLSPATDDEADDKPGRKLAQIKIDAVRELIEFVHLSAHRASQQRVVLIEPVEALNLPAANALLKILEEPPQGVVFLLLSHAPQRLLPTIRSRCRQFALSMPEQQQALDWLTQQGVADPVTELAHHGGAPLFDHDPALAQLRQAFIESLINPSLVQALQQAEKIDKQKLALSLPLDWLQMWLHDLLSVRLSGVVRYYPDHRAALLKLAQRADALKLLACQEKLTALVPFGQHTLNLRLQLEAVLMDYLTIFNY